MLLKQEKEAVDLPGEVKKKSRRCFLRFRWFVLLPFAPSFGE